MKLGRSSPRTTPVPARRRRRMAKAAASQKLGLQILPIGRIEDVVKPTDAQDDGLKKLENATAKAVTIMQAACPEDTPITPPGRLEAMEKRLQAMNDAANTVKPALNDGAVRNAVGIRFGAFSG